ncbi:kinase-like domain-containing protein [Pelagophyceae sp. CCMP2097]|nr:kinase-like domain-containing protein [Pelagophyceae sp. CCMP2097]
MRRALCAGSPGAWRPRVSFAARNAECCRNLLRGPGTLVSRHAFSGSAVVAGFLTGSKWSAQEHFEDSVIVVDELRTSPVSLPRAVARSLRLAVVLVPLAAVRAALETLKALAQRLNWLLGRQRCDEIVDELDEIWWAAALYAVERSGATAIKLCQWAATRHDLFPKAMTNRFKALHDDVAPHALAHTHRILAKRLGADWRKDVTLHQVVGSGCIAQVYLCERRSDGKQVVIKVLHPDCIQDVATDMVLIAKACAFVEWLSPATKHLNAAATLARFDAKMRAQLDLRNEARNLNKLRAVAALLSPQLEIHAPEVLPLSPNFDGSAEDLLCEEYIAGLPIMDFVGSEHASALAKRCTLAYLEMMIRHNFVHADLHPGNVLVDPKSLKVYFIDAGMCLTLDRHEHALVVGVLRAMTEGRGRDAAELMLESKEADHFAPNRSDSQASLDHRAWVDGVDGMVQDARTALFFESIGDYYSKVCDLACTNHVTIDSSFLAAALAIKVTEGIVQALDQSVSLVELAMPIFLKHQMEVNFTELRGLTKYAQGLLQ